MTKNPYEEYPVHIPGNQLPKDHEYYERLNNYFDKSMGSYVDKLRAFAKYVPVAEIGRFLAKEKIYSQILNIHGSVVECGVFNGSGIMTWATLSSIYEPLNHIRKIIGFDTFEGFPSVSDSDDKGNCNVVPGGLKVEAYEDVKEAVSIYDIYRPLGHISKVELVKGDASKTIPAYIEENKHLVVSLLYLDFDLYDPTKVALECFLPRMPIGAIIAFDQLNQKQWQGETLALLECVGISKLKIERFSFQPQISYAVIR